jgi:hypothetical protein
MLPDTGIDDVKKQRNAEYAKHINDPILSSLKMKGIFFTIYGYDFPFFFIFFRWRYNPLWALACRTISLHFFLSPTLSIFLLPTLKDLFLVLLSILSCVFLFVSSLQVLE